MAWMVFAGALAAAPADGAAATPEVVIDGTLRTSTGSERRARLSITCQPGDGRRVAMKLQMFNTAQLNFDLDAYEGASPLTAKKATAHVSAGGVSAPALIASGGYGSRGDAAFSFSIGQATAVPAAPGRKLRGKKAGKNATHATPSTGLLQVAEALSNPGTELRWTQDAARSGEPPLTARFAPEAWQSQQITDEIKPCQSPNG